MILIEFKAEQLIKDTDKEGVYMLSINKSIKSNADKKTDSLEKPVTNTTEKGTLCDVSNIECF